MKTAHEKLKKFLKLLGPGFITGASDDDPSGIATYSQAGARFGLQTLWTALFSFPFMVAIQEMCGRIGIVKGKGLSEVIKEYYGRGFVIFAVTLLVVANTFNIAADLGAMASALQLLADVPFVWWIVLVTTLTLVAEVFIPYKTYAKYLKYLTLSLFAYVCTAIIVTGSWHDAFTSTLLPSITFSKEYLLIIVAILGTTISPYLFFWQTSEEVEEEVKRHKLTTMDEGRPHVTAHDIKAMRADTMFGMGFSNLVMFFIILTAASTLFPNGVTTIATASEAAEALRPFAGNFTFLLFTLGIIGTGLLAVPILAGSASYALSEALGWKAGLSEKPGRAPGFYAIICAATIVGLFINLLSPIEPFRMLYYAAILNGLCAPPLMFMILKIANDKNVMGRYVNKPLSNFLGYTIAGIMSVAAVILIILAF